MALACLEAKDRVPRVAVSSVLGGAEENLAAVEVEVVAASYFPTVAVVVCSGIGVALHGIHSYSVTDVK